MANRRKSKEREEARRGQDREHSQRTRRIRLTSVAVVVVVIVIAGVLLINTRHKPAPASPQALSVSAKAAGCTQVETIAPFDPESRDRAHGDLAPLADYTSVPPVSGPHAPSTVSAGVYGDQIDLGGAVHALEHGGVVIWYSPSVAADPQLQAIKDFVQSSKDNTDHTIIAPYDYPSQGSPGSLTEGTTIALTAWHHMATCAHPSLDAVKSFLGSYRYPTLNGGDYQGDAPEPGVQI